MRHTKRLYTPPPSSCRASLRPLPQHAFPSISSLITCSHCSVRDAIVHPDTGEKVPLPFRVSAFAPSNIILTLGLLTPNPSVRLPALSRLCPGPSVIADY